MKTLLMGTAAALFAAGTAMAAETVVVIDTDGDGMISMGEYQAYRTDRGRAWFDLWDADRDGMVSADEFDQGSWSFYDRDTDDFWSMDEKAAWEEDELRFDSMRSGASVSAPGPAGGSDSGEGGAAQQ